MMLNLVDSSGWLEYFADSRHAGFFASSIEDTKNLVVPTICIFEVFKRILQQRDEDSALQAASVMHQGRVIDLDRTIAMAAARLGHDHKVPLADSVILATSRLNNALLWTMDSDFKGLDSVRYRPKK